MRITQNDKVMTCFEEWVNMFQEYGQYDKNCS